MVDVHSNDFNDFDFTFVGDFSSAFLLLLKRLGVTGQLAVQQLLASKASISSDLFPGSSRTVFWLFCQESLVLSLRAGFTLGFFFRSSVFYCVSVCFKIREFFIYFIKIKAVVLHIQIVVRDALKVILYKENLMLKRKEGSFLLHLNWGCQY